MTSEHAIKRAGIFNPVAVSRLITKCRKVKGLRMSNTDNMRIVAILSTMLLHHQFIEEDGRGECDEMPAAPVKVVDMVDKKLLFQ